MNAALLAVLSAALCIQSTVAIPNAVTYTEPPNVNESISVGPLGKVNGRQRDAAADDDLLNTLTTSFIESFIDSVLGSIRNVQCRNHTEIYLDHLFAFKPWAVKMFDASSKISEGVLEGNIRNLGNFDECIGVHASVMNSDSFTQTGEELFKGQYCLADLHFETLPDSEFKDFDKYLDMMTSGRRFLEVRNRKGLAYFPRFAKFEWSICIPSSCSVQDLQGALDMIFDFVSEFIRIEIDAKVNDDACYTSTPLDLHSEDYVYLCIALIIVLMISIATSFDISYHRKYNDLISETGTCSRLVIAFSFPKNWSRLWSLQVPPSALKSVDGIRFLSTVWVIFTHKVMCITQEPISNKAELLNSVKGLVSMPLVNSWLCVDTFFLVSGLLKCYNMLMELDHGTFHYIRSLVLRYIRLTPPYAMMIGFYATIFIYFGSGPSWIPNIGSQQEWCRENWMWNLLYVNNYVDSNRLCMIQSWYLSADMHLFLLAPVLIYPLWRWPKYGKIAIAFVIGLSIGLPVYTTYVNQYASIQHVGLPEARISEFAVYVYYPTHQRLSSYVVGIVVGYIFHKMRGREIQISKFSVGFGWFLCLTTLFGVVYGPFRLLQLDHPYNVIESCIYGGVHRFVWAIAVGWIIFICDKGYGGYVNSFLSARIFRPLSKLSYCMFLAHMIIILYNTSTIRSPSHMDHPKLMHELVGDLGFTLIPSVILYVCLESPFVTVTKILTTRMQNKKL